MNLLQQILNITTPKFQKINYKTISDKLYQNSDFKETNLKEIILSQLLSEKSMELISQKHGKVMTTLWDYQQMNNQNYTKLQQISFKFMN